MASVPGVGPWLRSALSLWMFAALVVGVRQGLDYDSTVRALAVCLIVFGMGYVLQQVLGAYLVGIVVGLAGGT